MIVNSCNTSTNELDQFQVVDEVWLNAYKELMFTDNFFVELIKSGELSEKDLYGLDQKIKENPNISLQALFQGFLDSDKLGEMEEYNKRLERHFDNVRITGENLIQIKNMNSSNIHMWAPTKF